MMRLESPFALLLLLFLPLVLERSGSLPSGIPFFKWCSPSLNFAFPAALEQAPASWKAKYGQRILSLLKAGALFCFVLALARPQSGSSFLEVESGGRDIMLVLDTSGSMQALDFFLDDERVRRIDALKHVVNKFIDDRIGDRLGLVVFGTTAYTQCPLTLDHLMLKSYIDRLEIGMAGDNTSLGDALALSVKRIKDIKGQSKVIVLVTDGKQTSGKIDPVEAAEAAKALGIKVHAVGIGSNEPVPFRVRSIFGLEQLDYREVPLDERTLQTAAARTGGMYFNAKNLEELQGVYNEIDRLEERKEKAPEFVEYEEDYYWPLAAGLLLFLAAQICSETLLRIIP